MKCLIAEFYPLNYFYPERVTGLLKELAQEENIVFGQQGFAHYCQNCFKQKEKRNPWHENKCLYGNEANQADFMFRGKTDIEEAIHASPIIYVAPNHQFNEHTKTAAALLGYSYFAVKGIINLQPYEENGLIVLPERKLMQKGEIIYTHYDQMQQNIDKYFDLIKSSVPLSGISPAKKPKIMSWINDRMVIASKRARDLGLR